MSINVAQFRFYEELNDFLPPNKKKKTFPYEFKGKPSVKDAIEALGIPHTEVELILANGQSVGFDYHLRDGDRISVYPVFESIDISPLVKTRKGPLREPLFVLDVHLGKLARLLRLLGFDVLYRNDYDDRQIIELSIKEGRIILTQDVGILKNNQVTHGYFVRFKKPLAQAREVVQRFDLFSRINPLHRCMLCNGLIEKTPKKEVISELPPKTAKYYDEFYKCLNCGKIYWRGSHYDKIRKKIEQIAKT